MNLTSSTLVFVPLAFIACASTPIPETTDAAAAQHDQLAARDDQLAAAQAAKYDPNARHNKGRCAGGGAGVRAAPSGSGNDSGVQWCRGLSQPSGWSSPSSVGAGGSGGTVTCSGVTSPGMKVMSTSSPGSPSSFALRATRMVEPGSSWRPST